MCESLEWARKWNNEATGGLRASAGSEETTAERESSVIATGNGEASGRLVSLMIAVLIPAF